MDTVKAPNWSNKTVLIAEDLDDNFAVLTTLLHSTKITIVRAKDGVEAVNIMQTNPNVCLVLMDISMPNMDGIEATRLIKQMNPGTVVIAQSAHGMPSRRIDMEREGCCEYLLKPIRRNLLFKTMSKYLSEECNLN